MNPSQLISSTLALSAILVASTALAQAPGERWAPAQLVNKRTGETLKVKCFDSDPSTCTQFQYFQVDVQGNEAPLTRMLDAHAVEATLSKRREREENLFTSKKPLYLIKSSDGFLTMYPGEGNKFKDTEFSKIFSIAYGRLKYESGVGYAAKVTGATIFFTPLLPFMLLPTVLVSVADIALLPIRGVGKIVLAFSPNHSLKGPQRIVYKQALHSADTLLDQNGDVYITAAKWNRIRDRLSDLR